MFGFLRIVSPANVARTATKRTLPHVVYEVVGAVVMLALLALAFAIRFWAFWPQVAT